MTDMKSVPLLVIVPQDLRTRVKIAAARNNCTNAKIVVDALEAFLIDAKEAQNGQ